MKHKVVEEFGLYMVMYKKAWYTRWKHVKDKQNPGFVSIWETKRGAQAYINFLPKKK